MKKHDGLTLLECLIVIAISCILLCSAATAYHAFIRKNQLMSLVDELTDTLEYARDAAITLQTTITLCPKNKDGNWQQGELILDEKNQRVLRELPAMPNQYHLYWRSTLGDSDKLQWRASGFTRGQQGSFFICGRKEHPRLSAQIIVLRTGRIRVEIGKISGCNTDTLQA